MSEKGARRSGHPIVAGLVFGLWLGFLLGMAVAIKWNLAASWTPFHLIGLSLVNIIVVYVWRALIGRPGRGRPVSGTERG